MKRKVIFKSSRKRNVEASNKQDIKASSRRYIKAADDDEDDPLDDFTDDDEAADGIMDAIDDVADNVDDLQDSIDDMDEDDLEISVNNNIADHYIAECDRCGGVFISAVVESDQEIDHVSGVCPMCGRESEQALKWVIKAV